MAAVTQRQRRAWQTSLIHAKVSTLKNTLTLLKYCQTVAHFIQKRDQIEHPTDRTLTNALIKYLQPACSTSKSIFI